MKKNSKIALLGGDRRQTAVGRRLAEAGLDVRAWRVAADGDSRSRFTVYDSINEALYGCDAVVLPFPAACASGNISCPMADGDDFPINELTEHIGKDCRIFGGKLPPSFKESARCAGAEVTDYFESEEVQIKNAVLTAEGAISLAICETDFALWNSECAVLGFGRIGKILSDRLHKLGASVTVCARKSADITWAQALGYSAKRICFENGVSSVASVCADSDIVFNTVPYWLLDESVLKCTDRSTLIIDLASAPGGTDINAAQKYGIRVIRALALPARYSPVTAGNVIGDFIIGSL